MSTTPADASLRELQEHAAKLPPDIHELADRLGMAIRALDTWRGLAIDDPDLRAGVLLSLSQDLADIYADMQRLRV